VPDLRKGIGSSPHLSVQRGGAHAYSRWAMGGIPLRSSRCRLLRTRGLIQCGKELTGLWAQQVAARASSYVRLEGTAGSCPNQPSATSSDDARGPGWFESVYRFCPGDWKGNPAPSRRCATLGDASGSYRDTHRFARSARARLALENSRTRDTPPRLQPVPPRSWRPDQLPLGHDALHGPVGTLSRDDPARRGRPPMRHAHDRRTNRKSVGDMQSQLLCWPGRSHSES